MKIYVFPLNVSFTHTHSEKRHFTSFYCSIDVKLINFSQYIRWSTQSKQLTLTKMFQIDTNRKIQGGEPVCISVYVYFRADDTKSTRNDQLREQIITCVCSELSL